MITSKPDSYQSSLSLRYRRNVSKYYSLLQPHPHPPAPTLSTTSTNPSFITSAWTSARSLNHSPGLQAVSPPVSICLIGTLPPSYGIHSPSQCGPPISRLISHHSSQSSYRPKEPFSRQPPASPHLWTLAHDSSSAEHALLYSFIRTPTHFSRPISSGRPSLKVPEKSSYSLLHAFSILFYLLPNTWDIIF